MWAVIVQAAKLLLGVGAKGCSRATGGVRRDEEPGSQTPTPGAGLGHTAYLAVPLAREPFSSYKKNGLGGLSFGTADGWQVCQQDLKHLGNKKRSHHQMDQSLMLPSSGASHG